MPRHLATVEVLRPIEFTEALVRLQGMIGAEVKIVVNHHGHFSGCGFQGRLMRVQTLPPDNLAVRVVLEGGQGLSLDPLELSAFVGGDEAEESWLEFQMGFGPVVSVEVSM